ncbi:MAG TPA: TetR/AcrR family transcriptional regulator [Cyclobacteriaceae bacterium]|nr:TetR/AcrR family transcriptional regulator [Cyclobacteriaceae bacterium]
MVSTRERIIQLTDTFIRDKGYNAFSFYDIAEKLKIKNASIHYYFSTKTDLGLALLESHTERLHQLQTSVEGKNGVAKIKAFLSIYNAIHREGRICIVGSLATDIKTVEPKMAKALSSFANEILLWVTTILEEGKGNKTFSFTESPRTKALMIITNMLAAVQLTRLTGEKDFIAIRENVLAGLKIKK